MTHPEPRPRRRNERLLPFIGIVCGLLLVVVPFVTALVSIGRASYDVAGGLRGATHEESKERQVEVAFRTTSLGALLIPPGVLLLVVSALSLAKDRKRRG